MSEIFEEILAELDAADCVVVGLGERFDLLYDKEKKKHMKFYEELKARLGSKDYHIVTQAEDDLIFQCGFDKEHVAAPYIFGDYGQNWDEYMDWLSMTIRRKLLVLELGVGFANPHLIRFPFERLVGVHFNSKMYRVDPIFWQLTADIATRAVSVREDPFKLFEKKKEKRKKKVKQDGSDSKRLAEAADAGV